MLLECSFTFIIYICNCLVWISQASPPVETRHFNWCCSCSCCISDVWWWGYNVVVGLYCYLYKCTLDNNMWKFNVGTCEVPWPHLLNSYKETWISIFSWLDMWKFNVGTCLRPSHKSIEICTYPFVCFFCLCWKCISYLLEKIAHDMNENLVNVCNYAPTLFFWSVYEPTLLYWFLLFLINILKILLTSFLTSN